MTPKEYVTQQTQINRGDFIDALVTRVRKMKMSELLALNPTVGDMRYIEYVRDIGCGHYSHHSDSDLVEVVRILKLAEGL